MYRKWNRILAAVLFPLFLFSTLNLAGQTQTGSGKSDSTYQFVMDVEIPHTSVKSQGRTGTCWCFSTISMLESEILRMDKDTVDLSEMYIVRRNYMPRAWSYVRLHGKTNFAQGAYSHDVMDRIRESGLVPESVYTGRHIGEKGHNHGELEAVLSGMLDGVLKRRGGKLTPVWPDAVESVLNVYLGTPPESFEYKGKRFTPMEFASGYLNIDPDDYVEITSYPIYDDYTQVRLEVPDNWSFNDRTWNLPLDDFERVANHALKNGYSLVWGGDTSNRFFSTSKTGYGIVPVDDEAFHPGEEKEKAHAGPVEEKIVTPEMRQEAFDNWTVTDDHAMHIVGLAHDQAGTPFYYTKNSHGTDRRYGGYVYLSRSYFLLNGIALMVNKNAIPDDIRKKCGI